MRYIFYNKFKLLVAGITLLGFSCNGDSIINPTENENEKEIAPPLIIEGKTPVLTDVSTRTQVASSLALTWSESDQISVRYEPKGRTTVLETLSVAAGDVGKETANFVKSNNAEIYWTTRATEHTFYTLHPYATISNPSLTNISVPLTQSQTPFSTSLLFATRSYDSYKDVVELEFNQPLTLYRFVIDPTSTDLSGESTVKITIGEGGGIAGTGQLDFTTAQVTEPTFEETDDKPSIDLTFSEEQPLGSVFTVWVLMFNPKLGQDIKMTIIGTEHEGEFDFTISHNAEGYGLNSVRTINVDLAEIIRNGKGSIKEKEDEPEEEEDGGEDEH